MDGKTLARIVAVIFVAIAVTLEMVREEEKPASVARRPLATSAPNTLREGRRRCQILGQSALRDDDCLRLWAKQRDRFLGFKAPSTSSASELAASQSPDSTRPEAR
jgi:conjugative transfer region protein TrbK